MKILGKKNIVLPAITIVCLWVLCGCNKEPVFIDADTQETMVEIMMPETIVSEAETGVDSTIEYQEELVREARYDEMETTDVVERIKVHVCGAVVCSGVYELDSGSRVVDGVSQAGGLLPQAAPDYVNLAAFVSDGDKIWIPTVEEAEELLEDGHVVSYITTAEANAESGTKTASGSDAKININTADKELLCSLPGIGSTRADSIISYREQNGNFSSIEDIMKVSGIKDNSFQKIKEYICVK